MSQQMPAAKVVPQKSRVHNRDLGRAGESLAAQVLESLNYQILDRNWRCREGEVDLVVCTEEGVVAFVEVKTRSSNRCGTPGEAITEKKLHRMRRVARAWLRAHREVRPRGLRLDLFGVYWDGVGQPNWDYRESIQ